MWHNFEIFAIISLVFWLVAIISSWSNRTSWLTDWAAILGIASLALFLALLWTQLQRPPLRTLGETRLWYAFFLATSGFLIFKRWKLKLMLFYTLSMAILFLLLNYLNPDIHSKTLMPALQSVWFVPHVIVYMVAYAQLGLSALLSLTGLVAMRKGNLKSGLLINIDNVVYVGFGFLSLGLVFGALWAKEAWGHYWTWDPKETWAFITWAIYLIYIHFRIKSKLSNQKVLSILLMAFIVLLICWFGVNYLPSAQNSVHVYSN